MGKRDKTRFEKWFSLSHHKRRIGAKNLSKQINIDFKAQKKNSQSSMVILFIHMAVQTI